MNLAEIEEKVAKLDLAAGFDFIFDLLLAYDLPKSGVTLLRKGSRDLSDNENELLWKDRVFYRFVADRDADLHSVIDAARNDEKVKRSRPRFLVVQDGERLLAVDSRTETTLDIPLSDLQAHSAFFMPWAGVEKTQLETLNYADVKAAEKMARLYDEIAGHNEIRDDADVRNLNVFFSRLLFCFFAEDTRVFEEGSFTDTIASLTQANGTDTGPFLDQLFEVLDTNPADRDGVSSHFQSFGYVGGRLFAERAPAPKFSAKARRVLLECGTLDWSIINPDIFGSMIQAVVQPGQRGGLGMHYTSVENIMKVIRPLFLDDLHERFDRADTVAKLQRLLDHICDIKLFDPACGSGNFLIIAYKELRKLEHRILQRMGDLDPNTVGMFKLSGIKLDHFYGIEIDDFAHEIAILSLWLAKHQMNVQFSELFGVEISLIPLKDTGNITCGNAARLDWTATCPPDSNTFVCGNPPYQYGTKRTKEQSEDLLIALEDRNVNKYLDYVAIWFYKGAQFIRGTGATLGFVSTNSICQGKQVELLWPRLLKLEIEIAFARTSFSWSNSAKGKAGVTCVIIGLSHGESGRKRLVSGDSEQLVAHISPYLSATSGTTIVGETRHPLSPRPEMNFGSMPRDGGHLLLTREERDELVSADPRAAQYVRPFVGSSEFIKGTERFCLWVNDDQTDDARQIEQIDSRLTRVEVFRSASDAPSTRKMAATPHRFGQISYDDGAAIVVPAHSSERRDYIPIGYVAPGTVVSNAVLAIYGAEPWLFGLLESQMHMAWMRAIGGRIKKDYRYSKTLVYNTFPLPSLTTENLARLSEYALVVIRTREEFPGHTLEELYDPDKMPEQLRQAHLSLDGLVDSFYQKQQFKSDIDRLGVLLPLYEKLAGQSDGGA